MYDIADHPDFRFRTTDFVIRIGNAEDSTSVNENEASHICVLGLRLQHCDWGKVLYFQNCSFNFQVFGFLVSCVDMMKMKNLGLFLALDL